MSGGEITSDTMAAALATIARWRMAPDETAACPLCGSPGLRLSDHSARPPREWDRLVCAACGLDQMLALPLGAAVPGGEG